MIWEQELCTSYSKVFHLCIIPCISIWDKLYCLNYLAGMIIGESVSRKLKLNTGSILDLTLQIQWQISTVKSKSLNNGTSWHARHCTCNPVNRCHGCNPATPHINALALLVSPYMIFQSQLFHPFPAGCGKWIIPQGLCLCPPPRSNMPLWLSEEYGHKFSAASF